MFFRIKIAHNMKSVNKMLSSIMNNNGVQEPLNEKQYLWGKYTFKAVFQFGDKKFIKLLSGDNCPGF